MTCCALWYDVLTPEIKWKSVLQDTNALMLEMLSEPQAYTCSLYQEPMSRRSRQTKANMRLAVTF